MGLRHRSIRLRVGILIIVPVLCLIGLYGFAASITLGSALTQAHTKTLRIDLLTPVSNFQAALAQERHLALLSLASPSSTQFASEVGMQENNTRKALDALRSEIRSPAVADNATVGEQQAINNLLSATGSLPALRANVAASAISTTTALADYDAIIDAGYNVIDEASAAQTSVPIVTQAINVISLARGLQAGLAESDLLAADMTQRKFPDSDKIVFAELATQRQQLTGNATAELLPAYRALLDKHVTPAMARALTAAEARVIATTWRKGPPPLGVVASTAAFAPYAKGMSIALTEAGNKLQDETSHQANVVFVELLLAAGLGLLGTIASIALSLIIGRGLVRQLRELRESALTLAHDKLPSVIGQLRAGEQIDPAEYAPGETAGGNEIQQVQHAFNVVQQTAVQSAIDEARLRRGISDVFRNLAGRSQSLLHRQLTLLDGMERRATEPGELEDLFRIDHLTTRMRRHAEGLIILSGEAPARGWRQPVPLVDVLRAAVAEVEDYTRIRVLCRTNAAVAGHAVADVIHLVAELAENATVFSPPNTPVRIQGDIVGRGFAVEIEDRGLGISQARMDEINANLANPPQFDLSGSDRLGLFIAGQLALRHDIKITLRPSVYGGTTAILIIPTSLVVEADTYERDPALPAGHDDGSGLPDRIAGRHSALSASRLTGSPNGGNGYAIGPAGAEPEAESGLPVLPVGTELPAASVGAAGSERFDIAGVSESEPVRLAWSSDGASASEREPVKLTWSDQTVAPGERDPVNMTWSEQSAATGEREPVKLAWSDQSASTGEREPVKLSWTSENSSPGEREPVHLAWSDDTPGGRQRESATGWPAEPMPDHMDEQVTKSEVSELGLPVRVRQASLAPQLRKSAPPPPSAETSLGAGFYSGATAGTGRLRPGDSDIDPFAPRRSASPADSDSGSHLASPEAARSTMSALQRGWQLGRSEAELTQDAAQPPRGYSPSGYPPNQDSADSTDEHDNE
jgi:signal transduction histidine kinase